MVVNPTMRRTTAEHRIRRDEVALRPRATRDDLMHVEWTFARNACERVNRAGLACLIACADRGNDGRASVAFGEPTF